MRHMIISMLAFRAVALRSSILLIFVPFRIVIFLPFSKWEGGSPCLPYMVHIIIFWFTCSIQTCIPLLLFTPFEWPYLVSHSRLSHCQLGVYSTCLDLMCLPSFLLEVQSLTLGELFFILISIPLVGFSKLVWIFATFLTYSFYPSSYCTKIHWLTTCLIHAILFGQ